MQAVVEEGHADMDVPAAVSTVRVTDLYVATFVGI
jgi:hypothetical protein